MANPRVGRIWAEYLRKDGQWSNSEQSREEAAQTIALADVALVPYSKSIGNGYQNTTLNS